ncbi:uncharacterized protein LOC135824487 [Sycon ciliatum]|uniref:uncharacterized protein LOC135824487 n=1 Tax=Sycon ciliatum TaxID=27933 RepID=UPI0031F6E206
MAAVEGNDENDMVDIVDGGRVSKFLLGEKEICFNPSTSRAVCAATEDRLAEAAVKFRAIFQQRLGIPPGNVVTLSTKAQHRATSENLATNLKASAETVGSDGLLLFSFAGHGKRVEGTRHGYMVPAASLDEDSSGGDEPENLIGASLFDECLSGCKARTALLFLDCCFSGRLLRDIQRSTAKLRTGVYIMSAAGDWEATWYFYTLRCSMFTFFVCSLLEQEATTGAVPVRKAVEHVQELCPALAALRYSSRAELQEVDAGISLKPFPELFYKRPSFDEEWDPIFQPSRHDPLSVDFINSLLSLEKHNENLLPDTLCRWLQTSALPSLKTLYRTGYLKRSSSKYSPVFACTRKLLITSAAKIMLDHHRRRQSQHANAEETNDSDQSALAIDGRGMPADADVFLRVMQYLLWIFEETASSDETTAEPDNEVEEKPTLQFRHFISMAKYYFVTLACSLGNTRSLKKFWRMLHGGHSIVFWNKAALQGQIPLPEYPAALSNDISLADALPPDQDESDESESDLLQDMTVVRDSIEKEISLLTQFKEADKASS